MNTHTTAFQAFLNKELKRRRDANPRYSLRAFARDLKIDASFLSKLLKGKRTVTKKMLESLRHQLDLPESVEVGMQTEKSKMDQHSFYELNWDQFHFFSDWIYFAILELTYLEQYEINEKSVASIFNLTHEDAQDAILRLERLGYLVKMPTNCSNHKTKKTGKQKSSSKFSATRSQTHCPQVRYQLGKGNLTTLGIRSTNAQVKKLQASILTQSQKALKELPLETRDHTSMTMAFDSKDIQKAKRMITKFRRRFCEEFQKPQLGRSMNAIYQLQVSFFPISQTDMKE